MKLAELHNVIWGDGYNLTCMDNDGDNPEAIGEFGYDDNKPAEYMDCEVVGIDVREGALNVVVNRNL